MHSRQNSTGRGRGKGTGNGNVLTFGGNSSHIPAQKGIAVIQQVITTKAHV